jgi:hypothetical protein
LAGADDLERLPNGMEMRLALMNWQKIKQRLADLELKHPWATGPRDAYLDIRIYIQI